MDNALLIAIIQVILIDLILGLDNAVVIALSVKNLESRQKKIATYFGAGLAIGIRFIFVVIFMSLGQRGIPLFYLIGGLALIVLGWKLMGHNDNEEEITKVKAKATMTGAIMSIVIADAIMSVDNALAISQIAFAASEEKIIQYGVAAFGMLISVPIILFGASLIGGFMKQNPWVIYVGAFIIIHVGAEMIFTEQFIAELIPHEISRFLALGISTGTVILKIFIDKKGNNKE